METVATEKKTGLFITTYRISTGLEGAPTLELQCSVDTVNEHISGMARITQAVNPPLNFTSKINGDFTYMCIMPRECHILVTATGHPSIKWPIYGGIGPVIPPNFHIRMVLSEDWATGTANFNYLDTKGNWQEVKDAKVLVVN